MSITLVQGLHEALVELLETNPEVVLLGADLGAYGGIFRVSAGLQARFGSTRVIDTPPNPQTILGLAQGLRVAGKLPICELEPEAALLAGPLLAELAALPAFSRPLIVRVPVQDSGPEVVLSQLDNVTVLMPANPAQAKAMLKAAAKAKGVVVLCETVALYRGQSEASLEVDSQVLTQVRKVREGEDAVFLAYGEGVDVAYEAATRLEEQGYWVGVVDVRVLSPLDVAGLKAELEACGRGLVVAPQADTFARSLAATVTEAAFFSLEAPVTVVARHLQTRERWLEQLVTEAKRTLSL